MRKLFLVTLMIVGSLVMSAKASSSYVTFTSSAIAISSATGLEILSVEWGTGDSVFDNSYLYIADTVPASSSLASAYSTVVGSVTLLTRGWGNSTLNIYDKDLVTPPIMLFTSAPITASGYVGYDAGNLGNTAGRLSFVNPDGSGREIRKGIAVFKTGTVAGTTRITLTYRKRR